MAKVYSLHPKDPQTRNVDQICAALRQGAVMLYPTDTVYAIGCDLNSKPAIDRVRSIKRLANDKPLTFLCSSLSNIASYAYVSDPAYRLLKRLIPGPYTFLLPATKLVPKLVMEPKRRTTGIRVPDHAISQALLSALDRPIISTSAASSLDTEERYLSKAELFDELENRVDIIIDNDLPMEWQVSTVLDLTGNEPWAVRRGLGWDAVADWVSEEEPMS
ncbi:MAG: threonylcarbamoyl-AMP synthase [Kaiparowitsia implicata GSE-PSE-MK54-09C]|jgi:tRNA threonylcarbamoyl adenosine modification protein (Sua5/YciO/YrdC/YwlC family)|nr:threonylcarbamoyl-AMP synthase [Kaiparowitsia implicata GSE-PSE-MK54-09C]